MYYLPPIISAGLDLYWRHSFIILLLMLVYPLSCFVLGILTKVELRFRWYIILLPGIMFIPTTFIFYNYTALYYIIIYILMYIIGAFLKESKHNFKGS